MKTDWFTKSLLIAILIAQLLILLRPQPTPLMAQDEKSKTQAPTTSSQVRYDNIRIFTYANGLTGIFDTNDGMIYLYDSNLERPLFSRQLVKPGEPMKRVR